MRTMWIIAGMRRSGIHAVTNWIRTALDAAGEPHLLVNNVRLTHFNHKSENVVFSRNYVSAASGNSHILIVYEDKLLRRIDKSPLIDAIGADEFRRLVVVRDPYNLTASRLQKQRRRGNTNMPLSRLVTMWPDHAQPGEGWVQCVYNRWFRDEDYRRQVAESLALPSCPPLPVAVARAGDGSSFDGLQYDGRAGEMPVLDRWRHFVDDPDFVSRVNHPQLAALSEQVCGFPNPLKEAAVDS